VAQVAARRRGFAPGPPGSSGAQSGPWGHCGAVLMGALAGRRRGTHGGVNRPSGRRDPLLRRFAPQRAVAWGDRAGDGIPYWLGWRLASGGGHLRWPSGRRDPLLARLAPRQRGPTRFRCQL